MQTQNVLRTCATHPDSKCGGTHWIGHNSQSMGGVYYCPTCLAKIFAEFDPQPGDIVNFIDGPQTDYVVLFRVADQVTMRHMGRPELPSTVTSVRVLWGLRHRKAAQPR